MIEKSRFNIKFDKILQILCSEIYDSPLSMLRENVQNAYDAILMRQKYDTSMDEPLIEVSIDDNRISISDNGIGMTAENLHKNYWTAGSSGKNNERAKAAGVVGTFGIGAMANFGVCKTLKVITRHYESNHTITSWVNRDELYDNVEECIKTTTEGEQREIPGTTVVVELDEKHNITPDIAEGYLKDYIKFLNVPLLLNGENISNNSYHLPQKANSDIEFCDEFKTEYGLSFHYRILLNNGSNINPRIEISNISTPYKNKLGCMVLDNNTTIYGLRNGFGLSQIPLSTAFGLGGIVDLVNLIPTAGRDAISRTSIDFVSRLLQHADRLIANAISSTELADNSRELIQYIRNNGFYDLAKNIKIGIANSEDRITLGEVEPTIDSKTVMYYSGNDKTLINSYEDRDNIVLVPSADRIRRQVQLKVLRDKHIQEIADSPVVSDIMKQSELELEELSILFKIKSIVEDDYLVQNCLVDFAQISHGLSLLVKNENEIVHIYIKRQSSDLETLKKMYKDNYGLFEPFVKDYVRTNIYTKIAPYIPSSQKDGADALYEMLQRKKELYTIESTELGSMDYVLNEYLQGRASVKDVLEAASKEKKRQTQTLESNNIGNVQDILGDGTLSEKRGDAPQEVACDFEAAPSIMRLDTKTEYKVLATDENTNIEGYKSFVALSERLDRDFRDFFFQPHTTRVIWSIHKIIYIFTHASGSLTLYYEMELRKKLSNNATGGRPIKTATIITQNKIFVPIIAELHDYFDIKSGKLTFMVHYDSVRN